MPHRESYWNIGNERYLVYLMMTVALAILAYGVYRHILLWRLGQPENRSDQIGRRIGMVLKYAIGHARTASIAYPGLMHLLIFVGMVLLFVATALESANYWLHKLFDVGFLEGNLYLGYSLMADLSGVTLIAGLAMAAYRRYIQRPERVADTRAEDGIVLGLLFLIALGGFVVEGLRIAVTELSEHPGWASWSPVGLLFARVFQGVPEGTVLGAHRVVWFTHLVLAQVFVAYVGYSKLGHILYSPLNMFFASFAPKGALRPIPDIETAETWGVANLREFTWKQLLDVDACTACGRCQDACPAWASQTPLSPKQLILGLRPALHAQKVSVFGGSSSDGSGEGEDAVEPTPVIGEEVTPEGAIWACVTCRACQQQCPVFIEHVQKIVDLRRSLVMVESRMPQAVQDTLTNLEQRGHPWRGTQAGRLTWAEGLEVKSIAENQDVDYLYWVGCTGALVDRTMLIAQAMARIMDAAGVSFAVLGAEETCCGEPSRRLGNEYLYQMQAMQVIQTLQNYGVKKIVTHCPHCFNTIKNEYPQFGGEFEVVHHSELIAELISSGRIRLQQAQDMLATYHDSCYLGRHNDIYQQPRSILAAVPGARTVEMGRNREGGFCCGAGGGHMWMEDELPRINHLRTEEALSTGANTAVTACPFCIQMFEDGFRFHNADERVATRDIAEVVAASLPD